MPIHTPEQVQAEASRLAGRGLAVGLKFLANRVREMLSAPAPRRIVTSGARSAAPGVRYYRATTPAIPGAPPRKLSGRLRASIADEFDPNGPRGRVGTNVVYGRRHEQGNHPWLLPTLTQQFQSLEQIVGQELRVV